MKNKLKYWWGGVKTSYRNFIVLQNDIRMQNAVQAYQPILGAKECKNFVDDFCALTTVKDVEGSCYKRFGRHHDGGYVMLDDFQDCPVCYSFGICDDVSWDLDFAKMKKNIFMYDHTISGLPMKNQYFHWSKTGVCGESDKGKYSYLKTLKELLKENGHLKEKKLVLKMDVEGAEWDVLSSVDEEMLGLFDQIVMEMHWIWDLNYSEKIIASLKNLNKSHQLVHVHGSNGSFVIPVGNRNIPNVIETTYVRKQGRNFIDSKRFFPTSIDEQNNSRLPEVLLGYWNE